MIKSMTAYARHAFTDPQGQGWLWELRSVNHRYLEQGYRLPEAMRAHEQACRSIVAERLDRGKVDISLKPMIKDTSSNSDTASDAAVPGLVLNAHLLADLIATGNRLAAEYQSAPLTTADILRWPGMLDKPDLTESEFEAQKNWLTQSLNTALNDFITSRETEGEKIADMIRSRCKEIQLHVDLVTPRRESLLQEKRDKLLARIAELGAELNQDRLEQEVALLAQKLDVSEELDRLEAHLTEVNNILNRDDAVGRRLDFMMQELNREANTLGSKSNDQTTTQAAIDIKVLLEQMREQIQNVE